MKIIDLISIKFLNIRKLKSFGIRITRFFGDINSRGGCWELVHGKDAIRKRSKEVGKSEEGWECSEIL